MAELIRARPAAEHPIERVRATILAGLAVVYERDRATILARAQLIWSTPALRARIADNQRSTEAVFAAGLGDPATSGRAYWPPPAPARSSPSPSGRRTRSAPSCRSSWIARSAPCASRSAEALQRPPHVGGNLVRAALLAVDEDVDEPALTTGSGSAARNRPIS